MASGAFAGFIGLIVLLFFIPKALERIRIPAPLTEFAIGLALALLAPGMFDASLVGVFATIGIITVFLFAGFEINKGFIQTHKKQLFTSTFSHLLLIAFVTALLMFWQAAPISFGLGTLTLVAAVVVTLTLVTPSAGFILSMLTTSTVKRKQQDPIKAQAISAELLAIGLLIIMLNVDNLGNLLVAVSAVALLLIFLPLLLRLFHKFLISELVNAEFPFMFVIAVLCAFLTELVGIHYLAGAFIAGLVLGEFLDKLVENKELPGRENDRLKRAAQFMSVVFVPFYFFSVGYQLDSSAFDWRLISIAAGLFVIVSILRVLKIGGIQAMLHGSWKQKTREAWALLPTLMVGFIFAQLLLAEGMISQQLFTVLVWYAVMTSLTAIPVRAHLEDAS